MPDSPIRQRWLKEIGLVAAHGQAEQGLERLPQPEGVAQFFRNRRVKQPSLRQLPEYLRRPSGEHLIVLRRVAQQQVLGEKVEIE